MLQGHPSRFWGQLYDGFVADGHRVLKIHFCLADLVYWGRRPAITFRKRFCHWQNWLRQLLETEGVTDVFYYADRHPYHVEALNVSRQTGARCWTIEFGYLRPDWLTLEPEGMGAGSTFPKTRSEVEAMASGIAPPDMRNLYPHDFPTEAFHEVTFSLLQVFGRPFYPFYKSDKLYWPVIDYLSWIGELALDLPRRRAATSLLQLLGVEGAEFNLLAMQIQADHQIRSSSDYQHLSEFMEEVFASFAANAPTQRHLVVKLHPLDNGLENWFRWGRRLASKYRIESRLHVIKGGDLDALLRQSVGVVVVNSTVGIHALRSGVPTYVAGRAVFNIAGLTHQDSLDTFWREPNSVDRTFFTDFEKAISKIQVKGSFFNQQGRTIAIDTIRKRFRIPQN